VHKDIRYYRKKKHAGRPCDWCKAKAYFKLEIATSYMRGDDEILILCESCVEVAKVNPHKPTAKESGE
jgi:hypothetical protein